MPQETRKPRRFPGHPRLSDKLLHETCVATVAASRFYVNATTRSRS